jgi:4-oxalocrotonate tautomerase
MFTPSVLDPMVDVLSGLAHDGKLTAIRSRPARPQPISDPSLARDFLMPFIDVTLIEGRSPEKLRALIRALHEAVVTTLDADPAGVRVVLREVPATHWAAGNQTIAERRADAQAGPADGG